MRLRHTSLAIAGLLAICGGCQDEGDLTTFRVQIENVSPEGLLDTDRANGIVPLSPGVYAVYEGDDPVFEFGELAGEGLELLAEDGFPSQATAPEGFEGGTLLDELESSQDVLISGVFTSPGGPDEGGALFAGESVTFTIDAEPGDELQLATMFVQSNDWFVAFDGGGIALFDVLGDSIDGDVTDELRVYDAGTEEDTAPGTGEAQKPVQDPNATDVGPSESVVIQLAEERHPSFEVPAPEQFIRVTVTPLGQSDDDDLLD